MIWQYNGNLEKIENCQNGLGNWTVIFCLNLA